MIKVVLNGLLWVKLVDLSKNILAKIKYSYTYEHPYESESSFSTSLEKGDYLGVPFGNHKKALSLLPSKLIIIDERIVPSTFKNIKLTGLELRPYQKEALQEILNYFDDGGTSFNLSGDPGSGKTIMIAALLAKMNIKTLLIAHLTMLTSQISEELSANTNANICVLTKSNKTLGDVNISTSQFISKNPDIWAEIKNNIGLIIVDEAETISSPTTLRILQRSKAKYKIAVTATFTRSMDGRTPALIDIIGNKVVTLVNPKLLKPTIIGVECPEVFIAPPNKNLFKRFQTAFYRRFSSIDNKILKITQSSLKKQRQVLVVSDIIEMQNRYKDLLETNNITVGVLNSKTKAKDRREILVNFNSGDIQVLIGASVLNAGLSIPKISVIIRVSFANSREKLIQLIGRALRDYEGKQGAYFVDLQFGQGVFKREQIYRLAGYKYHKVTWHQFEKGL